MPEGWVLRKALVRSHRFRALYPDSFTQLVYCLLQAVKDSWGMVPADPLSLKGELGPFDPVGQPDAYRGSVNRLWDVRLVYEWEDQGDPWIYMIGHDERYARQKRAKSPRVPRPDLDEMNTWARSWPGCDQVETKIDPGLDLDRSRSGTVPPARAGIRSRIRIREGEGEASPSSINTETKIPSSPGQSEDPPPSDPGSGGQESNFNHGGIQGGSCAGPGGGPASTTGRRIFVQDKTLPTGPGDCMVPSPLVSPGRPGGHPSRVGDLVAHVLDNRPTSDEHLEIQQLLEEYRAAWCLDEPPIFPAHDNLRRVREALKHPGLGFERCKAAVWGHRKLAGMDGSQLGRDFRLVFPPARNGGQTMHNRVDVDRVSANAAAHRARPPGVAKPYKPEPTIPREEAEQAAQRGLAAVRDSIRNGDPQ